MTFLKPCVIFAAGTYYGNEPRGGELPENAFVIVADGGLNHVRGLGIQPDLVIGDFDSANVRAPQGVETIKLPPEHDDPDMLSALKAGWARGFRSFRIYGGLGGRIDHTIANIQMLALLAHNGGHGMLFGRRSVVTSICNGSLHFPANALPADSDAPSPHSTISNSQDAETHVATPDTASSATAQINRDAQNPQKDRTSANTTNRMVSVFSHSDVSRGVTETGLKYELENGTMRSDTVLGVSNELLAGRPASISVSDGTLIVTFPIEAIFPAFSTTVSPAETLGPLASEVSSLLNPSR
ncbi:thiamine diphosphokinase [Bifidobacterium sp. ESL0790]|uniref:thiamine diphosphokinase n=1 Tax=Bifidobacterium sp. ESL0790 TaxID=2983233 RepID=UPI0023F98D55|nr:thiamine diphosphokinase [Bifidobacterium sp. ESL0790]WEV72884.1 thiamine diphosphokinase [Bifidobacterium sp. ESL0790]